MKVLGIAAAAALALGLSAQSFAMASDDNNCPYDSNGNVVAGGHGGYQKDANGNLNKCTPEAAPQTGTAAAVASPAAGGVAGVGGLSAGAVVGIAAVVAVAVAVAVGNGGNKTGPTTTTTGTH